jgi:cation:H+ antiporter
MLIEFVLLVVGLAVLAKSSTVTIDRAVILSRLSGISQMMIGFVFIAVATSLPELTIGIISSLRGNGLLSVGNLLGANILNLTLVLGSMAFAGFILEKKYLLKIDQSIIITTFIAFSALLLGRIDFAFGVFCLIVFYLFSTSVMKEGIELEKSRPVSRTLETVKAVAYLLVAVAFVILSSKIITENSVMIASQLGVAESVIGATILSMGTTLPELSVSVAAVKKKNISLALGNIIGSIVTNLTLILGIVAVINPLIIGSDIVKTAAAMITVNVIFMLLARRMSFGIKESLLLGSVFIFYLFFAFA